MGGFFGALLGAAGGEVALVARGAHAQAIRARGLRLLSGGREIVARPTVVTPGDPPWPADALVVAVKHRDLPAALNAAAPSLRPGGVVLSLLNGIGHESDLHAGVPHGHLALGMAFVGSSLEEPGVIRHTSEGRIAFGEPDGPPGPELEALREALSIGGFPVRTVGDVRAALWRKLMWNAAFNATNTLVGGTCKDLMEIPGGVSHLRAVMEEVRTVANAQAIDIPADWVEKSLAADVNFTPYVTSMRLDRERGKPMEIEPILSRPLRSAETNRVATPRLATLEMLLRALERGETES